MKKINAKISVEKMLIMLDKRQRQVIAMNSVNLQQHQEVFRSMNVESGSKTPYTDATQVRLKFIQYTGVSI